MIYSFLGFGVWGGGKQQRLRATGLLRVARGVWVWGWGFGLKLAAK